jgi:hypothetical protein
MTEGRKDGMTEGRNRVTLYAPAITWRGHKKNNKNITQYFIDYLERKRTCK